MPIVIFTLILVNSCVGKVVPNPSDMSENMNDTLHCGAAFLPADSDLIHECISEDGNVKFISWNTGMGGTCPDYGVICVFKTAEGKVQKVNMKEKDPDVAWVHAVHSIKKDDGSTFYIASRSHRASSNEGYAWMDGYMIFGDSIKAVSVLDGSVNFSDDDLDICYSIFDWSDATNGEGFDWLFEYDAENNDIYVPETIGEKMADSKVTDRYTVYHFDGTSFVSKGIHPHKGLNECLHDYRYLESYFRTKNYIIRIDRLVSGELRYASWKSTSSMLEMPDMIMLSGSYDENNGVYTFENNGVTYLCRVSENIPTEDEGVFEHHEYLIVKKGTKVMLKEEIFVQ